MENDNKDTTTMEYLGLELDADHARDSEPQDHAEDPIEAVELEAGGSLVDLSNGHPVDAVVLETAKLLMLLKHQEIDKFFCKTPTQKDATIESLRISKSQATLLFPGFSRQSFTVGGNSETTHTIRFQMHDEKGRNYNEMKFVGYLCKKVNKNKPARITCEIKGEWRRFVKQNKLMKGDDVCIHRNLLVEDDFHFIFKVVRNGGNEEER